MPLNFSGVRPIPSKRCRIWRALKPSRMSPHPSNIRGESIFSKDQEASRERAELLKKAMDQAKKAASDLVDQANQALDELELPAKEE